MLCFNCKKYIFLLRFIFQAEVAVNSINDSRQQLMEKDEESVSIDPIVDSKYYNKLIKLSGKVEFPANKAEDVHSDTEHDLKRTANQKHEFRERPKELTRNDSERPMEMTRSDSEQPMEMTHNDSERPMEMTHNDSERPMEMIKNGSEGPMETNCKQMLTTLLIHEAVDLINSNGHESCINSSLLNNFNKSLIVGPSFRNPGSKLSVDQSGSNINQCGQFESATSALICKNSSGGLSPCKPVVAEVFISEPQPFDESSNSSSTWNLKAKPATLEDRLEHMFQTHMREKCSEFLDNEDDESNALFIERPVLPAVPHGLDFQSLLARQAVDMSTKFGLNRSENLFGGVGECEEETFGDDSDDATDDVNVGSDLDVGDDQPWSQTEL